MRSAAALVALVACGGAHERAAIPARTGGPPGVQWITPALPWRIGDRAAGVAVDGERILVGGSADGTITEIDLATGARGRAHAFGPPIRMASLVRLRDGRLLVTGTNAGASVAAIVDPSTFAAIWFPLEPRPKAKHDFGETRALELADGTIAIGGPDLALAIYDGATGARRTVLDARAGWTNLTATRTALYASHLGAQLAFDLATGTSAPSGTSIVMLGFGETVLRRALESGAWKSSLVTGGKTIELPGPPGAAAHADATGERIASVHDHVITVHGAADGRVLGRYDLAPQRVTTVSMAFAGSRLVVTSGPNVRVIDLDAGTVTPLEDHHGPYAHVAAGDDGTVVAIGSEVWRFANGRLAGTASLGTHALVTPAQGEVQKFAVHTSRPWTPQARAKLASTIWVKTIDARAVRDWSVTRDLERAWLGRNGRLLGSFRWTLDGGAHLFASKGSEIEEVSTLNLDTLIDDVDADAGIVAVSLGGTATLFDVASGQRQAVYNPGCAELGLAELERGGTRVATYEEERLIVWDRATGKALGGGSFSAAIADVVFVPGERPVFLLTREALVLWDPATATTRALALPELSTFEISPNKRNAVLAFTDGRIALVDLAALRGAMTAGPAVAPLEIPKVCSDRDPLDPKSPEERAEERARQCELFGTCPPDDHGDEDERE